VDLEAEILEVAALEDVEEMEVAFEAEEAEVIGAVALAAAALAVVSEMVEVVHFTTNLYNSFTILQSLFVGTIKSFLSECNYFNQVVVVATDSAEEVAVLEDAVVVALGEV